jgi:hypothetical protein
MTRWTGAGLRRIRVLQLDSTGYAVGGTAAAAAGASSDPIIVYGAATIPATLLTPTSVTTLEDDGPGVIFQFESTDLPQVTWELMQYNTDFDVMTGDPLARSLGDATGIVMGNSNPTQQDFVAIINRVAKQRSSSNATAYETLLTLNTNAVPTNMDMAAQAVNPYTYAVTYNKATRLPWGELIGVSNDGVADGILYRIVDDVPWMLGAATGDGSTTAYTVQNTPNAEAATDTAVWVDGTAQVYTTDYTVTASTKTFTFEAGSIPANNAKIVFLYGYTASEI